MVCGDAKEWSVVGFLQHKTNPKFPFRTLKCPMDTVKKEEVLHVLFQVFKRGAIFTTSFPMADEVKEIMITM